VNFIGDQISTRTRRPDPEEPTDPDDPWELPVKLPIMRRDFLGFGGRSMDGARPLAGADWCPLAIGDNSRCAVRDGVSLIKMAATSGGLIYETKTAALI